MKLNDFLQENPSESHFISFKVGHIGFFTSCSTRANVEEFSKALDKAKADIVNDYQVYGIKNPIRIIDGVTLSIGAKTTHMDLDINGHVSYLEVQGVIVQYDRNNTLERWGIPDLDPWFELLIEAVRQDPPPRIVLHYEGGR